MNIVNIMGNVGNDPEIKKTDKTTIANFSVATKGYNDKVEWHRCVAFGKTAEVIEQYVNKGDLVGVTGEIQYREYDGKYYTDIVVNKFHFGSSKKNRAESVDSTDNTANGGQETDDLPF